MPPDSNNISVLLVDNHPITREGLKRVLEILGASTEVGEASTAREALAHLRESPWDMVVLDLSLPDVDGMSALKRLMRLKRLGKKCSRLPVLIVSAHAEDEFAVPALKAGASGYVSKTADTKTLLAALKQVLSGKRYITAKVAEQLAANVAGDVTERLHMTLSDREFQVLRMIAFGKRSAEIANELCLSPKTVYTYRTRVLEKMQMKCDAELVRYAYTHHLLD